MSLALRIRRRRRYAVLAVVIIAAALGYVAYDRLFAREIPVYANDEENFKYGSIGNDAESLPYAIWVVLPEVFPKYLPGGYASIGFRWESGRAPSDTPLGFSRARVGVERIAINCAFCHITTFLRAPNAPMEYALAGPGNAIDVLSYQNFLTNCAADPKFSVATLLPAIERHFDLSWIDRIIYRIIIPLTRRRLQEQGRRFAWAPHEWPPDRPSDRPKWGPGRIDPFNPVKFGILGLADDGTIGNSDMLAIWNLGARDAIRPNAPMHWDGLNNSVREVIISSALGDGMTASEHDARTQASLRRIGEFLRRIKAPASPHRPDRNAIARGRSIYVMRCADCHDVTGSRTLTVIPIEDIRTDRHRIDMWTTTARDTYTQYRKGYDWDFRHFQKLDGYIAEPMDGLWLRAPYLHNGSVPTLEDLLKAPEERPKAFVRGTEVLDSDRGGFVAPECDPNLPPPPDVFCFDTQLPGNSNSGHVYGTDLNLKDKSDLLAYLLTL